MIADAFSLIKEYHLKNSKGMKVSITNYGASVTSIIVADKKGIFEDVCLGYASLNEYISATNRPYFGAIVGRCANRIANGKFTLNNCTYQLNINNDGNHLHGGNIGFDRVIWDVIQVENTLELSYLSKDTEEGYPGNVNIKVRYSLSEDNELTISYHAISDKDTPFNLSSHIYFNLNAEGSSRTDDHYLMINADSYTPINASLIPTGEIRNVTNSPFDFKEEKCIKLKTSLKEEQIDFAGGYDHNWVLNKDKKFCLAATVHHKKTGRFMEVFTDEPGVQFYAGNSLDGKILGKSGKTYKKRSGICLETQHYPDSPNHSNFPSIVLKAGEIYESRTTYHFLVQ